MIESESHDEDATMRRIGAVVSIGVGVACAGVSFGDDAGPPLVPPSAAPAAPAASRPAAELAPAIEATPPRQTGPVLAVPGLRGPGRVPPRAALALPALEPAGPSGGSPGSVVTGSTESLGAGFAPRPVPGTARPPITLESEPGGEPAPRGASSTLSGRREALRTPAQAPRRAPGIFGRFLAPPSLLGRPAADADDSISVEPRSDPATDAALKRRLEHQIRQSLGDRVQTVEVRVVGREVTVRARATRFWQRRAVRRSIETLPSLSGFRPTIDVE